MTSVEAVTLGPAAQDAGHTLSSSESVGLKSTPLWRQASNSSHRIQTLNVWMQKID